MRAARDQAARTLSASRGLLESEDARYRALVVVGRFTAHSAIVFVLVLAVILAGVGLGATSRSANRAAGIAVTPATSSSTSASVSSPTILLPSGSGRLSGSGFQQAGATEQDVSVIVRNVVLDTAKPVVARIGVISYTVRPGDNVETIAQRFGLLPTTITWSNRDVEDNPDILRIGQVLDILPIDGVWYTVQSDDTLSGIADKFKAKIDDIIKSPLNNLTAGSNLLPGVKILIPGGVKPFVPKVVEVQSSRAPAPAAGTRYNGPAPNFTAGGNFLWPTQGVITQGFWYGHRGIDIANAIGIPVRAADGGYVTYAGWSNVGYGYMVMIDHGNGFVTLYAHLSQWYVDGGQAVARGQIIGAMGSTGNSTGPHTHFEVRYGGVPQNPLIYLP